VCVEIATLLDYLRPRGKRQNKRARRRLSPKDARSSRAEHGATNMTATDPPNAAERKRARRLEIARRSYEALVAQDPNRAVTLCDEGGKVVARHDPLPEHDAPGIVYHGPTAGSL
jgi:hypothetical protein